MNRDNSIENFKEFIESQSERFKNLPDSHKTLVKPGFVLWSVGLFSKKHIGTRSTMPAMKRLIEKISAGIDYDLNQLYVVEWDEKQDYKIKKTVEVTK